MSRLTDVYPPYFAVTVVVGTRMAMGSVGLANATPCFFEEHAGGDHELPRCCREVIEDLGVGAPDEADARTDRAVRAVGCVFGMRAEEVAVATGAPVVIPLF